MKTFPTGFPRTLSGIRSRLDDTDSMKQQQQTVSRTATKTRAAAAYSERATDIFAMAETILDADWGIDCTEAHGGHVGDLEHARSKMVEAMVALGAMTIEIAKTKFGVIL